MLTPIKTVVLVEDNPLHRRLIERLLARGEHTTLQLESFHSLAPALQRVQGGGVDLVLLDLILPETQGLETLMRMRACAPELPVVVLTGVDDMDVAVRAVNAGAQDYVLKDQMSPARLQRAVRYALERAATRTNEWDSPVLRMAHQQFLKAAQWLGVDDNLRQRLLFPQRTRLVSFAYQRDDGEAVEAVFGYRVQHLRSMGPTLGSVRFHPRLNLGESAALAFLETWRAALLGLPFGGADGGVRVDPRTLSPAELERITRRYIDEIFEDIGPQQDIVAPGSGTTMHLMAWVMDAYSRRAGHSVPHVACGKPEVLGGLPHAEQWAARGMLHLADLGAHTRGFSLSQASAAIQGFGQLGRTSARLLARQGARILAVSDETGAIWAPGGLAVEALLDWRAHGRALLDFPDAQPLSNKEMLTLPCDVLFLAATQHQITAGNAPRLHCQLVVEAAHAACTGEADEILMGRDILLIPDLLGAGGASVAAYFEWAQGVRHRRWTPEAITAQVHQVLADAFERMCQRAQADGLDLRTAAMLLAIERVSQAQVVRGMYP